MGCMESNQKNPEIGCMEFFLKNSKNWMYEMVI
jgi:hypothetical protein